MSVRNNRNKACIVYFADVHKLTLKPDIDRALEIRGKVKVLKPAGR